MVPQIKHRILPPPWSARASPERVLRVRTSCLNQESRSSRGHRPQNHLLLVTETLIVVMAVAVAVAVAVALAMAVAVTVAVAMAVVVTTEVPPTVPMGVTVAVTVVMTVVAELAEDLPKEVPGALTDNGAEAEQDESPEA